MAFDPQRYRQEVLDPARAAGNRPPEDLTARYQLPEPLTPTGVGAALAAVRAHWRKQRATLAYRKVVDALEADDRSLTQVFDAACAGDLQPLRREIARRRGKQADRQRALADELAGLAEPLGLLTPAVVDQVVADGHDRGQVEAALERHGIQVRDPDPVPADPPVRGFRQLRAALDTLDCRHTAEFLFGRDALARGFTVLGDFQVTGQPSLRLDQARVAEVARQWQSRLDGKTPAETVLTFLRGLSGPDQLRGLLAYECAEDLRRRRDRHAGAAALLKRARDLGVAEADAKRLAFAVRNEATRAGSALASQLAELLAEQAVMAAYRLVDGVAEAEIPPDAQELAGQATRLARRATALRDQAAASKDPDTAWRLLDEAQAHAPDLADLSDLRRRLPPHPPGRPLARVVDGEVVVSWPASASPAGQVRYQVRRHDRPPPAGPAAATTGTPVADTDQTVVRDGTAPVNAALHYTVVAQRGGVAAAPVATAGPVWLRPEVTDLRVTPGEGMVSAAWRTPPGAARVAVRRCESHPPADPDDGTPVPVTGSGFTDQAVRVGRSYHYLVSTVYLGPDGTRAATPGRRFTAVPALLPEAVADLRLAQIDQEPGWLRVEFPASTTGVVELRELDEPPEHPAGTRMATAALPGRPVPAVPVAGGLKLRAPAPPALLLAVTVNGDLAAIGPHRQWRALPSPAGLRAQRRGDGALVTWQWPAGVGEVEVRWRPASPAAAGEAAWQSRTLSAARYRTDGGVALTLAPGARYEITAAAVVRSGGERLVGPTSTATVVLPARAWYTVARKGWTNRRVEVSVRADQVIRIRQLLLVAAAGGLPLGPSEGEVLAAAEDVEISPEAPAVLGAPAPRRGGGYWLRCFAPGTAVELHDPPRDQLRMS